MGPKIPNLNTIPKVINALSSCESSNIFTNNFNKLLCMFMSPLLFLSALSLLFFGFLTLHRPVLELLIEGGIFILFGVCFEILLRAKINVKLTNHLISILYNVVLFFAVFWTLWTRLDIIHVRELSLKPWWNLWV